MVTSDVLRHSGSNSAMNEIQGQTAGLAEESAWGAMRPVRRVWALVDGSMFTIEAPLMFGTEDTFGTEDEPW